jgi:hypothetical protein
MWDTSLSIENSNSRSIGWVSKLAEGVGFEPTVPHKGTTVFETAPIDHSGTPPRVTLSEDNERNVAGGACGRRRAGSWRGGP